MGEQAPGSSAGQKLVAPVAVDLGSGSHGAHAAEPDRAVAELAGLDDGRRSIVYTSLLVNVGCHPTRMSGQGGRRRHRHSPANDHPMRSVAGAAGMLRWSAGTAVAAPLKVGWSRCRRPRLDGMITGMRRWPARWREIGPPEECAGVVGASRIGSGRAGLARCAASGELLDAALLVADFGDLFLSCPTRSDMRGRCPLAAAAAGRAGWIPRRQDDAPRRSGARWAVWASQRHLGCPARSGGEWGAGAAAYLTERMLRRRRCCATGCDCGSTANSSTVPGPRASGRAISRSRGCWGADATSVREG
jgi:hypothetical protein